MKSDAVVTALKAAAAQGVPVDDALDQLAELVDGVHAKTPKARIEVVLSEVPVGFQDKTCVVGWDTCGDCHKRISSCDCKGGPVEPSYVRKFRQEPPGLLTRVTSTEVKSSLPRSSRNDVSSQPDLQSGKVCNVCGRPVDPSNSDQNDDKSYTCHICQGD